MQLEGVRPLEQLIIGTRMMFFHEYVLKIKSDSNVGSRVINYQRYFERFQNEISFHHFHTVHIFYTFKALWHPITQRTVVTTQFLRHCWAPGRLKLLTVASIFQNRPFIRYRLRNWRNIPRWNILPSVIVIVLVKQRHRSFFMIIASRTGCCLPVDLVMPITLTDHSVIINNFVIGRSVVMMGNILGSIVTLVSPVIEIIVGQWLSRC